MRESRMHGRRSQGGRRRSWCLGAALLIGGMAATAFAQDPVAVAPVQYRVEYEDDAVRVLRVRYGPGEKSELHAHPESIAVYVTGGHIRITLAGGRVGEPRVAAGQVMRHAAGSHAIENLGDTPFELVLVELKRSAGEPG